MSARYVPILESEFKDTVENLMGFSEIQIKGTTELVWQRAIPNSHLYVRIYSSITRGVSRSVGTDAIRTTIFDSSTNRPCWSETTYRTQNALTNMRERAREAWSHVLHNRCTCGGCFIERKGSNGTFYGCSSYHNCKITRRA